MKILPLSPKKLHTITDLQGISWKDSSEIPTQNNKLHKSPFQTRAIEALDLALQVNTIGYNIYLSGEIDLGRKYMLLNYLKPKALKDNTPPDLIYVQNFSNEDSPLLLRLPSGMGKNFKKIIKETIKKIAKELNQRFEASTYLNQRSRLMDTFHKTRTKLLHKIHTIAGNKGFNIDMDEDGSLTLYPLFEGKRLNEEDFNKLDNNIRFNIKRKGETLAQNIATFMHQLSKAEELLHDGEKHLEKKAMNEVLNDILTPISEKFIKICNIDDLSNYFISLKQDILKNTEAFFDEQQSQNIENHNPNNININQRYNINLFVDNSDTHGSPIIVENNPTTTNLLGCIERESEMGTLVTDFSLIKAGSLHKANGGYLVLHIDDLLHHPNAWEGLLRALRANSARIEDNNETPEATIRTKGISPEELPLQLKVILIGNEDIYETLLLHDERFAKYFKIKAHMTDIIERNSKNIRIYLLYLANIIKENNLPIFNKDALSWLVDFGSHLCEDQERLSLKFPLLREIMIEAASLAKMQNLKHVNASILEKAYDASIHRVNLVEDIFMEEYDRELIKVKTSGKAIGQVNGLSVTWHGNFEYGLPHSISCTVGVGHEGIIDLEREADLGGPIHTKAMMILKSYLTNMFARKKPLVLSGSLYFEQNYAEIEGDSASGAELVALLSAIAEIPVRLDLAFTGAVSHSGKILAVGGVNRKIEGFYKVCSRHKLTGTQGVIIPYDNIAQLMLAQYVLDAVNNGLFAIYPVKTIDEALLLLTGINPGHRLKNGSFTKDSLYNYVDKRLEKLGSYAQYPFKKSKK